MLNLVVIKVTAISHLALTRLVGNDITWLIFINYMSHSNYRSCALHKDKKFTDETSMLGITITAYRFKCKGPLKSVRLV